MALVTSDSPQAAEKSGRWRSALRVFLRRMQPFFQSPLTDGVTLIDPEQRARYVRTASLIGWVVGSMFAVYNLLTPGMQLLGWVELFAVLFLVAPAAIISATPRWVSTAETLLLLSALAIFVALIVVGGVEGTGLFWVYTLPFLMFFLKGQRLGWLYSLAFLGLVLVYWTLPSSALGPVYPHSPTVRLHFSLSLLFYTLVAAAFNHARTRFEIELRQRKEQAEAAYLAKSRFLAAASHDLRQPAHALGMFVARLTQLPHDAQTRELVAGVDASVHALQEMLDAFFDYSRLDAPSMQVRQQTFAINGVFDQLRTSFAGMAAAKGLRLRIRPSSLWVQSDPVLLHRVLLNLISNAVQHTHRGGILVACRPVLGLALARIEVWDSGIGIAPEHHDKIFEEFFQIGNHERDRTKGLGLGLSIVQRSCQLLNHPLTLRSRLGGGTRFTLLLSTAAAPSERLPDEVLEKPFKTELDGLRVLLIEDDALGSVALKGVLESWGCQVSTADCAQSACTMVQQALVPDFVVSDYRLRGDHNGIEAVRMVRELVGSSLAACVISGDTDATVRQQVQDAGLVLLQKPVRPAKLRSVLRHRAPT